MGMDMLMIKGQTKKAPGSTGRIVKKFII